MRSADQTSRLPTARIADRARSLVDSPIAPGRAHDSPVQSGSRARRAHRRHAGRSGGRGKTEMNETERRVWLVTGAGSGFGRAITDAAAAAGDFVVATARRPETLRDIVEAHPGLVEAVALDVTDAIACGNAIDEAVARQGRIDVLVNNAGHGQVGAVEETTEAELRDLFEVHFFGPVALTRAALP